MKAISVWQPWASLIAARVKPYETRHWAPPKALIGQRIAIHAAKRPCPRDWTGQAAAALKEALMPFRSWRDLPFGAVICTAVLTNAYRIEGLSAVDDLVPESRRVTPLILAWGAHKAIVIDEWGNYGIGRWAWHLTDIEEFTPAIPTRGAQGFFDWSSP